MSISLSQYKNRDRVLIVEAGRLHNAFSFARSSTAMVMNGVGTLVQVAAGLPRFEYSPAGVYLGLLIEGASTNLVTYSDGDVTTYPTRGGVTNATTALAPYFTNSIQFPASSGTGNYAYKQIDVTNGATYTLSVFIRMNDDSAPRVGGNVSTADMGMVLFGDVYTGATVGNMGGGVYRATLTVTSNKAGTANFGIVQYASNSGKAFRITGYQLESAASATSYVPTTSAAVTRSADVVSATLTALGISATAGTFVIEHDVPSGNPLVYSGSNTILNSSGGTKVAIAYDGSGWSKSVDGGTVTTSGTALTFSTTLDVGKSSTTSANGHIKRVSWYRTRRPNAELMRLSV